MTTSSNLFGKTGEQIAKNHLEKNGYEILEENWRTGRAEIDLIAYKNKTIIFIEVKTRSGTFFGHPEDFVNNKKQKLFTDAAEEYLYQTQHKGEIRFDIISIILDKDATTPNLKHIEDAFWNY